MNRSSIAALLIAVFVSPLAHAEGNYAGVFVGSVQEDGDGTDNIGFVIGKGFDLEDNGVDNGRLVDVNFISRNHPVEEIGEILREAMGSMKAL